MTCRPKAWNGQSFARLPPMLPGVVCNIAISSRRVVAEGAEHPAGHQRYAA